MRPSRRRDAPRSGDLGPRSRSRRSGLMSCRREARGDLRRCPIHIAGVTAGASPSGVIAGAPFVRAV
eukprot:14354182-Alexandrium_andersonii.AAC.1